MAVNITEFENEIKNKTDQELIELRDSIIENTQNDDGARGNDDYKKQVSIIDKVLKERGLSAAQYGEIRDIVKAINNNKIDYSTIQKFKDEQLNPLKERVAQLEIHLKKLENEPKPFEGKMDDLKSFSEIFNKKIDSLKEEIKKIKEQIEGVKTDNYEGDTTTIEGFNKIKSLNIDDKEFRKQVHDLKELAQKYNAEKDEYNNSRHKNDDKQNNEKKHSVDKKEAAVDNFAKQITNLLDEKNNALEKIKIRPEIFDAIKGEKQNKLLDKIRKEIDESKKNVKKNMSEDAASSYLNELTALENKIREFEDKNNQNANLQLLKSRTEASIKANKEKIKNTERILESVDKWNGVQILSEKTKAKTNIYNNKNDKTKELNPEEAQKKLQSLLGWEPIKTQNNIVRSTKRKKGAKDDEYRTYKVGDWNFEYSGKVETNGNEITISDNGEPFLTIEKKGGKVEKMKVHRDACLMVDGKPFYIPKDSTVNVSHTNNGVVISVINGGQEATITVENGMVTTSGDSFINWENRPKKEERVEETAPETDTIEETLQEEDVIEDIEPEPAVRNEEEMNNVDAENVDHQNTPPEKEEVKEETNTNNVAAGNVAIENTPPEKEEVKEKTNTNNVAAGNVDPKNTPHVNSDVKEEPKENNFWGKVVGNVVGVLNNIFNGSWMGNNNEQTSESSNIQDNKNSKKVNEKSPKLNESTNQFSENNIDNQQNDNNTESIKLNPNSALKPENTEALPRIIETNEEGVGLFDGWFYVKENYVGKSGTTIIANNNNSKLVKVNDISNPETDSAPVRNIPGVFPK